MPVAIVDPNISFLIPPGGSTVINLHNKGNLASGFARVYSSAAVTLSVAYNYPAFPATAVAVPATGSLVQIPVTVDASRNTGIALLALSSGQWIVTLREPGSFFPTPGSSRTIDVTQGQQVAVFVTQFLPDVKATQFTGVVTIESRTSSGAGLLSLLALQFDSSVAPVKVTVVQ